MQALQHRQQSIAESNICPDCGEKDAEVLSGREFMIKEIVAC
jgi:hydrogenase nickel incorporation protein HypA/HybF